MNDIENIVETRTSHTGNFATQAALSQVLKNTIMQHYFTVVPNRSSMPPVVAESLAMICHKLARIANGDPFYIDSWRDVEGYAKLAVDFLKTYPEASDVKIEIIQNSCKEEKEEV